MPFSIGTSVVQLTIVGVVCAALFWLVEEIRMDAQAQERAKYEAAIDDANADTTATNAAASKVAERDGRIRIKALIDAQAALAGKCPLTATEAIALTKVK